MATLIDLSLVIFCVRLVVKYPIFSEVQWVNIFVAVQVPLHYEPVLSAHLCTIGQAVMGTRVRDAETLGRMTLGKAYVRLVLKYIMSILGAASGPSAAGTPTPIGVWSGAEGRALHDLEAGTIVVNANSAV